MDPVVHYLEYGFREGREPGPDFDTHFYLEQQPGAVPVEMPPLLHYLLEGRGAGRLPRPTWAKPPAWYPEVLDRTRAWSLDQVAGLLERLRRGEDPAGLGIAQTGTGRPRVLFVIATRTGGTPLTNQDLMTALSASCDCLVLSSTRHTLILEHFAGGIYTKLDHHVLSAPIEPVSHHSEEYDLVLLRWLIAWQIALVHVRHIAWHSQGLAEMARLLDVPLVFSFHDYYTVCPTVKLLDDRSQFCGGTCTDGEGDCLPEDLWPADSFTTLKHRQVHDWQNGFAQMLGRCDAYATTSEQVRNIIKARYPETGNRPFDVIPHGRDFSAMRRLAQMPNDREPLRLLIPGNVTVAKGAGVIVSLAGLVSPDRLSIHVLGGVAPGIELPPEVVCHGPYKRDEFHERVAEIKPHLGAVLSIWPETWCHTLTELWAAGVPVVGFDMGAVGERLRRSGAGWVAGEMTAEAVAEILETARQPEEWTRATEAVMRWQEGKGAEDGCHAMAASYLALYARICDRFKTVIATAQVHG
jgi:glycosyltransferase involved in cell wall biosynthesis